MFLNCFILCFHETQWWGWGDKDVIRIRGKGDCKWLAKDRKKEGNSCKTVAFTISYNCKDVRVNVVDDGR